MSRCSRERRLAMSPQQTAAALHPLHPRRPRRRNRPHWRHPIVTPNRRRVLASAAFVLTGALALSACPPSDTDSSGPDDSKNRLDISPDSSVDILDPQAWRTPAAM